MDDMLHIPQDRRPPRPLRLTVLLGMTALLFLLMSHQMGWAL